MNASILLDQLITKSNGITLSYGISCPYSLLKEAILRGFQVKWEPFLDVWICSEIHSKESLIDGGLGDGYGDGDGYGYGWGLGYGRVSNEGYGKSKGSGVRGSFEDKVSMKNDIYYFPCLS